MNRKRIHQIYGWITAAGLLAAGVCLIWSCISIYRLGEKPFSPETVAVAFSRICVPVYICLVLVAGGFLLHLCLPAEEKKARMPQLPMQLARLQEKLELSQLQDETLRSEILSLRRKRNLHTRITYGLLVLCSILFLTYGLNPANFHIDEITRSMAAAMLLFIPCLVIPFGYGLFTAFYSLRLMKKEIPLLRQALREVQPQDLPQKPKAWLRPVQLSLLALGVFLLVFGYFSGGYSGVMTKAVAICTECVGLG